MSELDLLYTEVEEDLRGSVRSLLTDRCPPDAVAAMYDGDRSVVDTLWRAVAGELGLAGLLVPEAQGGSGASAREAAVVLEELGRFVAPVPFLTSSVIATTVLLDSDSELLRQLASGERAAALAVPFSTAPDTVVPVVRADGGRLHGEVGKVAGAIEADVLLVPVVSDDGWTVYATSEATVTPVTSLDMSRQVADVRFDGVAAEPVVTDALQAVRRALRAGAALLASEQYGVASWCLHTTVEYLRQRRQFGRIVGSFQALKHRLADLYAGTESAAAAARYAAAALAADDPDLPVAAAVAQSYCGDLAVRAAEEALQLHGGIGMTWEHPVHLYLKRAKADQIGLGTPGRHRAALAELVDLPA